MDNLVGNFTFLSAYTNSAGIPSAIYGIDTALQAQLALRNQSSKVRDDGTISVILPRHPAATVAGAVIAMELAFTPQTDKLGNPRLIKSGPLLGSQGVRAKIVGINQIEVDNTFKAIELAGSVKTVMAASGTDMAFALQLLTVVKAETSDRIAGYKARNPEIGATPVASTPVINLVGSTPDPMAQIANAPVPQQTPEEIAKAKALADAKALIASMTP